MTIIPHTYSRLKLLFILVAFILSSLISIDAQVMATKLETEDFEMIRSFYEKGFIKQSLDEILLFRKKYPGSFYDEDLKFYEAVLLLNTGDKKAALSKLKYFVKLYPTSKYLEDALFYEGAAEADLGESEAAIRTMFNLTDKFPNTEYIQQVQYYRVKAGFYKEDWNFVQSNLENISDRSKLNDAQGADLAYIEIWLKVETTDTNELDTYYSSVIEKGDYTDDQKKLITYFIGQKFFKIGKYRQALDHFNNSLTYVTDKENDPYFGEIHFYIGYSYFEIAGESDSETPVSQNTLTETSADTSNDQNQEQGLEQLESSLINHNYQSAIDAHQINLNSNAPFQPEKSVLQIGRVYYNQKKFNEGRNFINKTIKTDKALHTSAPLFTLLYSIDIALGHDKKAHLSISRAIEYTEPPNDTSLLRLERMRLSYKLKKCQTIPWDYSVLEKSKLQEVTEAKDEIISYAAYCKLEAKKYGAAVLLYQKIPENSEYYKANLPAYLSALKSSGKESEYKSKLKSADLNSLPKDSTYKASLQAAQIDELIAEKKWDEARKRLNSLIENKQGTPRIYYLSGIVWLNSQNEKNAEADFLKAFQETPKKEKTEKLDYAQSLTDLYKKNGMYSKQVEIYREILPLLKDKKKESQIQLYVANVYSKKLKNKTSALEWYGKLLKNGVYPYNVEAALEATDVYLAGNDMKNAQGVLTIILKRKLKKTEYYAPVTFKLASVLHYNEKYKKALYYYRESAKAAPKSKEGKVASKRAKELSAYLKGK